MLYAIFRLLHPRLQKWLGRGLHGEFWLTARMQGRVGTRPLSYSKPTWKTERQLSNEFRQLDPRQRTRWALSPQSARDPKQTSALSNLNASV